VKHPRRVWAFTLCLGLVPVAILAEAWMRRSEKLPPGVHRIGKIHDRSLRECSGLTASRRFLDVFWTHNDSGNREVLYAVHRDGTSIGRWTVIGKKLWDWEDIATDDFGNLYLADTGNNQLRRDTVWVHQIKEPEINDRSDRASIEHSWHLRYPAGPRNSEGLVIRHNQAYLFTKRTNGLAEIYRFPLVRTTNLITLTLVGNAPVGSLVSCATISADAKILALISPKGAFAFRVDEGFANLRALPDGHTQFRNRKIEGCTFTAQGLLGVQEDGTLYLFTNSIFQKR
jgi:hypothetical protein